jgi:hypothetical protein
LVDWDSLVLGPCMDVFGEPATYLPAAGGSFTIAGVFDEAYRDLQLVDTETGITTEVPVMGVRLSQFPNPPLQLDRITIPSVNATYRVREVRLDGHGFAKLMLNFLSSP